MLMYIGGDRSIFQVEEDKLSYFEIKCIVCENLGYKDVWKIHWCTPGEGPLSDHIRLMFEDNDVLKMLQANEESDEDDDELVGVRVTHMKDVNSKMLNKLEYEKFLVASNIRDNEEVKDNEKVRDASRNNNNNNKKAKGITTDKGKGIAIAEDFKGYDSDYGDSSDYDSPSDVESEQEADKELIRKMPRFPTYNPNSNPFKYEPQVGMKFVNPKELKFALICYIVANGKNIWFSKSVHYKLEVKCVKRCPWRIWGSWMQRKKSFQIKSYRKTHKCVRVFKIKLENARFWGNVFVRS
ncbi:hypothetical protein FRX31_024323 [Thalictrum thalictroides]|uniref:Transposase MuDR plant domain-containing protein n=1 Tax=Thalictrum thalictroides TaxID=46969 RepID=A0A7J6VPJ4_THATH|nr:hypothetical protein FRX31_024323 [Thalictrum thalictroides]